MKKAILYSFILTLLSFSSNAQTKSSTYPIRVYSSGSSNGYDLERLNFTSNAESTTEGAGFYGWKCRVTVKFIVKGYRYNGTFYSVSKMREIYQKYKAAGKQGEPKYKPEIFWIKINFNNQVNKNDLQLKDWGGKKPPYGDIFEKMLKTPVKMNSFTIASISINKTGSDMYADYMFKWWTNKSTTTNSSTSTSSSNIQSSSSNSSNTNSSNNSNPSYSSNNYPNTKPTYSGPTAAERQAEADAGYDKVSSDIDKRFDFYNKLDNEIEASMKRTFDGWAEDSRRIESFNSFKESIARNTKLTPSQDPNQIINEYNRKIRGIESDYKKRLQQRISNINRDVANLKTLDYGKNTETVKVFLDGGEVALALNAEAQIKKAKQKSKQDLRKQKIRLLSIIHNNLVADLTKRKKAYALKAAAEPNPNMEIYYKKVMQHYDCKISGVKSGFSVTNTAWVDPYCSVPRKPSYTERNPSSTDLYQASLRKRKSPDANDQEFAGKFLDMAIKKSPSNTTYLFERASYYTFGSRNNVKYLAKCVSAKPNSSNYKNHYHYAYALNKKESSYFKAYLKKHPRGTFASEAKKKYAYYLDREVREILYHQDVKKLNELVRKESFAEASFRYDELKKTEFYNKLDITQLALLKEFRNYDNATERRTADLLMDYSRSYPNGKWKKEVKEMLEPALIIDADKAAKGGDEDNAFRYYNSYLSYFPNGEKATYARNQKNSAQYEIMKTTIHEGDYAFENQNYNKSKQAFDRYLKDYPGGDDLLYAKKMSKKSHYKYQLSLLDQFVFMYSYTSNAGFTITAEYFKPKFGFYFGIRMGGLFLEPSVYQINEEGNWVYGRGSLPVSKNSFQDKDKIRFSSITGPVGINYPITHVWWLSGGFGVGIVNTFRLYDKRAVYESVYGTTLLVTPADPDIWIRDKTIGRFRLTLDIGVKVRLNGISFQLGFSKYPESFKLAYGIGFTF